MLTIDRRRLLAGTGGTLLTALVANVARAAIADAPPAPVARIAVVKDTYFGETLSDPYRWMENSQDPDWLPFLKGQNNHARAVLDAIPGSDGLLRRIEQLSGDVALTSRVQRAGGKLFYQQRPSGADNYKLFVRENGQDRILVLVDPTTLGGATGHVSLDWWRASPNGSYVVYGLSKDGSEDSLLHVKSTADGRDLPDRIPNTEDADPQWLDDESGFFYNQLTGAVATPDRYLDSVARFHRLGTDPAADPILMKRGLTQEVAYDRIQSPSIATFPGAKHVILSLSDIRPERRLYIAPLADAVAGRARWTQVAAFDDEITGAELDGDRLFLICEKGTPRGRVLLTSANSPSLASAAEVVAQGPVVIEDMSRARDGLYLKMMDGGVSRLRRLGADGHVTEIALPFDGTIGAVFANPDEDGVLMTYTGWLTPAGVWSVDGASGQVADTGSIRARRSTSAPMRPCAASPPPATASKSPTA